MSKLFTVAGTSNLEGVVKFRVANGSATARTKVLERSGHKDIKLQDLPRPMTKEDAQAFVGTTGVAVKTVKLVKSQTKTVPATRTKEVPAKQLLAEVGIATSHVSSNMKPDTKSIIEIAKIKSKNLETMRKVSKRLNALRSY